MKHSLAFLVVLLIANWCCCCCTLSIIPGLYSKKTVSDGLNLPATNTFQPISTLTTTVHLDKPHAVFVHYQITLFSSDKDFHSKLLINHANAGSLVHSGNNRCKSATGFYMANLNPGLYRFEVHYKSPVNIAMQANLDWQTAVLQVVWAEDARAVSDGIKCYPVATSTNAYNTWGPIRDLEAVLLLSAPRTILSTYQVSTEMTTPSHVVAGLHTDNFYQHPTTIIKGNNAFLDLHGGWAGNARAGMHFFGINYRTPTALSFTDCKEDYKDNKNLYAMMLPPTCTATTVNPKTSFSLHNNNRWAPTDVTHTLKLSKQAHVIIMYQYSGYTGGSHVVMRLSINSVPQAHTASLTGDSPFAGNFGLWQGALNAGNYKITIEYRSPAKTTNTVSPYLDWVQKNGHAIWHSRALTVISC